MMIKVHLYDCRQQLAELRDELQQAEDLRLEQEEEMWRLHQNHKTEMSENRKLLTSLIDEHEKAQAEAEMEVEDAKRRLKEDVHAG